MDAEIWEGFRTLNTSRQMGFDIGPIPLTEIKAFVELFFVSDVELFVACIRALDSTYLKHCRDKEEQKRNQK